MIRPLATACRPWVVCGAPSAPRVAKRLRPISHEGEEARPPAAPVEEVRRQSEESLRRKPIGLVVQVTSRAESIVDDDHARPWSDALRRTEVGGHLTPCRSDADVHRRPPWRQVWGARQLRSILFTWTRKSSKSFRAVCLTRSSRRCNASSRVPNRSNSLGWPSSTR